MSAAHMGREAAQEMAESLIDHGVDVSDEREVIIHLNRAGYASGTIIKLMDAATHRARVIQASSVNQALAS